MIWLRLTVVVLVAVGLFALVRWGPLSTLRTEAGWLDLIDELRDAPAAAALVILVGSLLSISGIPITPMLLATAAIFGIWQGSLLNYLILCIGATLGFALGRSALRRAVEDLLGARLHFLQRAIGRSSFWNLVRIRYIPIPFLFANLGLAICGVRWRPFLTSTAVAFLPIAVTWSLVASSVVQAGTGERAAALRTAGLALILLFLTSFIPTRYEAWRRKKRYERLLSERRSRPPSTS